MHDSSVFVSNGAKKTVFVSLKEVLRYMGCGARTDAVPELEQLAQKGIAEIKKIADFRACYCFYPLQIHSDQIHINEDTIVSKSLSKNLFDCHEVLLMAATIGVETDRRIAGLSISEPSFALAAEAAATATIEAYCDFFVSELQKKFSMQNRFFRPRFSPGYGDFSIEYQKKLFRMLDCERKIGITLSKQMMMVPRKSVTALIGISETDSSCSLYGCELCNKTECSYRRNT